MSRTYRPVLRYSDEPGDIGDDYCGQQSGPGERCEEKASIVLGMEYEWCPFHLRQEIEEKDLAIATLQDRNDRWDKLFGYAMIQLRRLGVDTDWLMAMAVKKDLV